MTYWAQLLHFYQPPTQTHAVLRRVADESYRPLLAVLKEHPGARIAININAVLTELLVEHALGDVVDDLRELGERGQVEFVGSGRYHPILPLIPEPERQRSIAENARVNGALLGPAYAPRGFFPPELCYGESVNAATAAAGHDWMILSGVACPAPWPTRVVHRTKAGQDTLAVLFRDDVRSNRISFRETNPHAFIDDLTHVGRGSGRAYVLTAMDAETYGHHIKNWEREFLGATYELIGRFGRGAAHSVTMVQPSELLTLFPEGPVIEPLASSWSTTEDDIAAGNPYPLWRAPGNEAHALQWEYVDHCLHLVACARQFAGGCTDASRLAAQAGDLLQPALHSCQFWWASRRPMWDPPMIHRGFKLLNDVLLYAANSVQVSAAPGEAKREANWRVAAANEVRGRLERMLFLEPAT